MSLLYLSRGRVATPASHIRLSIKWLQITRVATLHKLYLPPEITEALFTRMLKSISSDQKHKKKKKYEVVFSKTTIKSVLIDTLANKKSWEKNIIMSVAKDSTRT